jgi:pterin 4 alpha carbinolamine dehydratase
MPSSPTRCAVAKQARDRGGAPFQRSAVGIGGGAIDHHGTPAGNGHPAEPLRHREARVAGDPDPDIDVRWNKVTLALSSHAEGGLTDRDFQLAARIQELDQPTKPA